jgi:hypothetical protein
LSSVDAALCGSDYALTFARRARFEAILMSVA